MILDLILSFGGLAILLTGAWLVVRSASRLALMFGLSPVLVGATIVAFGTSAPEFVVSLVAGLRESSGLALGNIIGSNVANVGLVLGLSAAITPMAVHVRLLRWEIPVLGVATIAILAFAGNGLIERWQGIVMFAGLVGFIGASAVLFPESVEEADVEPEELPPRTGRIVGLEVLLLLVGLGGLTAGANIAVEGATGIAERAGLSDVLIGLTVVAIGTSLPELGTSAVAALRKEHEIAVANVVGSNIFNLLGVIGLTAGVLPLPVDQGLYRFEMIALAVSTLILLPMAWPSYRISRPEGVMLLALYVAFMAVLIQRA